MKHFPAMVLRTEQDIYTLCRYILKERSNDVNDFNNLKNVFIAGRKTAKIPSSSSDVVVGQDFVGDFNYTDSHIYVLVDVGGTAEWRRAGLQSW